MSMTLYEIANEYKELLYNLYNEESGEIDEKILSQLNALDKPIQEKCINTVRYLKAINAEYQAVEQERKAMQVRERALKSKIDWINEYLLENMLKAEITEILCPQFVIRVKKNPCSVHLYDQNELPETYMKLTVDYDVAKIRDDLKAGIDVPGAQLIHSHRISIK